VVRLRDEGWSHEEMISSLAVGSCRYGVMCRLDGMVLDDGTVARLAPDRFLLTTTTGNAGAVLDWLEEWLQTEWPDLRVYCTSVTEQWATVALVGPGSRAALAQLAPALDVSVAGFPFMTWRDTVVAGLGARVCRISFSGELAYEIHVPADRGRAMWEAVIVAEPAILLQHAVQGWCPPVTYFRRRGVRTGEEIAEERFALKALRGDFRNVDQASDALTRADAALIAARI